MKVDILIDIKIDKEPYIKKITNDKIINITGESGSGKSFFCEKYIKDDNYIVVDTDIIFSNNISNNTEIDGLKKLFKDKPKDYLFSNFDDFYLTTLNYFKDSNKTIVIDSAQYRNIKDYSILKGRVIVIRTSIETCYKRTLDRWKRNNKYNEEEFNKFSERKKGMFEWYKSLNKFIEEINKI